MKHEFEIGKWKYIVSDIDNKIQYEIQPPIKKEQPDSLYKYYSLSKNAHNALNENYIFASHPFHFNDPYDCFKFLIDFDDTSFEFYHQIFKYSLEIIELRDLYENHREKLIILVQDYYFKTTFRQLGILCLSPNPIDLRMWAYYSSQKGFAIRFDLNKLVSLCSKNNDEIIYYGPFPINYQTEFLRKKLSNDWLGTVLYHTNVKSDIWKHEDEYRYLIAGKSDMFIPGEPKENRNDRKVFYNPESILEIVLGFKFFDFDDKLEPDNSNIQKYKLDKNGIEENSENYFKDLILSTIIKNCYKIFMINISKSDYSVVKRPVNIVKTDNFEYELTYLD